MPPSQEDLHAQMGRMRETGAHQFDPVRFGYIEALLQRSHAQSPLVRERIDLKARKALEAYRLRGDTPRQDALKKDTGLAVEHVPSALAELLRLLSSKATTPLASDSQNALNERLRQQEIDVLHSSEGASRAPPFSPGDSEELRSFRLFKETRSKLDAELRVTRAILERPENPGHLNTQMLATSTLTTMRDLAPNYLRRMIDYLDTLFWLEHAQAEQRVTLTAKENAGKKT